MKDMTFPRAAEALDKIGPRQREVLALIAEGLPNKEIARRLGISEMTVKIHVGTLFRALGLRNRTEVALLVQRQRFDRLLVAFHDATRRPLGVTPDSGLEFYDTRMADEAEARRQSVLCAARSVA